MQSLELPALPSGAVKEALLSLKLDFEQRDGACPTRRVRLRARCSRRPCSLAGRRSRNSLSHENRKRRAPARTTDRRAEARPLGAADGHRRAQRRRQVDTAAGHLVGHVPAVQRDPGELRLEVRSWQPAHRSAGPFAGATGLPTSHSRARCSDDKGEWNDGTTLLKGKKQALDKIKEVLPISAEAAAMLLWGRQDDMTAVLETFPFRRPLVAHRRRHQGIRPGSEADHQGAGKGHRQRPQGGTRRADRRGADPGPAHDRRNSRTSWPPRNPPMRSFAAAAISCRRPRGVAIEVQGPIARAAGPDRATGEPRKAPGARSEAPGDLRTNAGSPRGLGPRGRGHRGCPQRSSRAAKGARAASRRSTALPATRNWQRGSRSWKRGSSKRNRWTTACLDLEKEFGSQRRPSRRGHADGSRRSKLGSRKPTTRWKPRACAYELRADRGSRTVRIAEDGQPEQELTLTAGPGAPGNRRPGDHRGGRPAIHGRRQAGSFRLQADRAIVGNRNARSCSS